MASEKPMGQERTGESLEILLRDTPDKLLLISDNVPVALMMIDSSGTCTYLNPECTDITGYTREDMARNTVMPRDIYHKVVEGTKGLKGRTEAGTRRERSITELNFTCKDGRIKRFKLQSSFLADGTAIIVLEDAFGQSRVKENFESHGGSENEFRSLAEQSLSLTGIFLIQDGSFKYVNPRLAEIHGYQANELINRVRPRDLVLHEERQRFEQQIEEQLSEKVSKPIRQEFRGITKAGRIIHLELYGTRTTVNGKPAIVGTLLDVTERKLAEEKLRKAEEKYRTIFENSVLGIFQTVPSGRIMSANPALARIYGYPSPEDLIKNTTDIAVQFYVDPERRKEFLSLIREEGFVEGFEAEMRRKDGSTNWVSMNARAFRNEEGDIQYIEGTVQDITERKKLEAELLQSQKMEAIGTLAGGIAHDFNNLLMGIQGYTSLMLLSTEPSHDHYQKLRSIEELVRSGADLTKQLLGFARGGRYQVKVTDASTILKNVCAIFTRTKKEITVHERYDEDLHPVEVDQSQIEQVFMNLFVNAWQAMPGGGHLYVDARNVDLDRGFVKSYSVPPGRYIKLSVTDTGVGMDDRTMKRIFEPFFTTKEMGRGTGLGLASVYGIVKGHKGFINVQSKAGHGSTFHLYIPASEKSVEIIRKVPEEPIRGTETVLLVDDEEKILEVGKEILETLGYKVVTASGGQKAIDIYRMRKEEIDLVILDMIMPDMEGGTTFDLLRDIDPGTKVILSSGYSLNSEAERIMERGCNAFMQKPFNIYSLSLRLREVLGATS